ncbi:hypothetical protein NSQ82_20570 [Caldifermentibacillus hisashii]|uniref:hypothetical protein n=1 Tax=Caldifermentibacillus hisashii TaxID=996558 RepID=UPI0031B726E0
MKKLFFASITNPFLGNKGNYNTFGEEVGSYTDSVNSLAPTLSFLFNAIFTIMFLFGIVRIGYALITKTGQVMKFSTGILIWVPITVFFIRLFMIFVFTTDGKTVTLLASDIIQLLKSSGYYFSIGMILVGLVFNLFYKLIKHPEYGRWSKRLWGSSAILILLVTIMPFVLGGA